MAAPGHVVVNNNLPVEYAAAVTKSDSTVLSATRALYIGGAGDVAVVMAGDGASVTFKAVPVGTTLAVRVTKVLATGTDATYIVALW